MDIKAIRKDFPILETEVYGKPLVYFDNAATTQKPLSVINIVSDAYLHQNANVHRGVHFLSMKATEAHEAARRRVAEFLHAGSTDEIVFTRGTTESINLVAATFAKSCCQRGDEIVVTQMEHHANIVPWQIAAEQYGLVLRVVPIDADGVLQLDVLDELLSDRTRLVSLAHVSNVLGTVNPVKTVIDRCHARNIPVLVDGAQAVAHLKVDVQALDADFYVFSGHKIYAPTGIGVLYGKREWLDRLPPYQGGGEMIQNVSFEHTTFNQLPYKFEAGTPDYVGSVALATALDYVANLGIDNIDAYEQQLLQYATEKMMQLPGMHIFGTAPHKSAVISFKVGNIHHFDLGTIIDKTGVAIRTGHHCAQPLVESMGVSGMARASFAFYNTFEEIDYFIEQLKRCVMILS
ncbi:MAG: cysteine desulfurase [Bacteroidales bacterium]|nr:cysteine desulfurase [Bacteroidales bacterium]